MAERLVNCSERRKPPASSTTVMTKCGVAGVNSALASSTVDASTPLTISSRRKPNRCRMPRARGFTASAPSAPAKVIRPELSASNPKQLQHQWQQEGAGADAEAEEQRAGNAGLEGLQAQQPHIEQRPRDTHRMAPIKG